MRELVSTIAMTIVFVGTPLYLADFFMEKFGKPKTPVAYYGVLAIIVVLCVTLLAARVVVISGPGQALSCN